MAPPPAGETGGSEASERRTKNGTRHFRVYEAKMSLTDQLVRSNGQFQSVYDAVLVQAVIFIVYVVVHDSWIARKPHFDLQFVAALVGDVYSVVQFFLLEVALLVAAFLVHPALLVWRYLRIMMPTLLVDVLFVAMFIGYVVTTAFALFWTVFTAPLSHALALIAGIEQIRLSMKSYSFIRENAYKVLYPWHKEDESGPAVWYAGQMEPQVGSFSSYLYFLFSPTLLYRDKYPRLPGPVNWKNVLGYFTYFVGTVWYMVVLVRYFLYPPSFRSGDLLKSYMTALLLAFLLLVIVHTSVFHAYVNFASELTRFADRQFYNDWWTSKSFSSYYRKWNTLVHDWIYSYLYLDLRALFTSPLPAIYASILLSSLIHEYLLAVALGFASPVLLIEFAGFGVIFYFIRHFSSSRLNNLMVLSCLSVGMGNLIFYYMTEMAARNHCPRPLSMSTFFTPRMFECYAEHN